MKPFTKTPLRPILIAVMSMTLMFVVSSLASAQEGARVYLQPVDSTDGRLTVDIMAENVTDMYGAEVQLTYDPAVVSVQDANPNQEGIQIEAGSLLPTDQGFVVANRVNEDENTIIFALTLLNPAPPVQGSGPLARVTFNVLNQGDSTIDIKKAKLISIDLQTIPNQTVPLAIGNIEQQPTASAPPAVDNAAPDATSGSGFPWWIVAAGIMILGLLGLGALVIMSGANKSSQQANNQLKSKQQPRHPQSPKPQVLSQTLPQRIDQQRPKHMAGTRPSAFK